MAIRARFLLALVAFVAFLASGTVAPGSADYPSLERGGPELSALPPAPGDLGPADLFVEHMLHDGGSVASAAEEPVETVIEAPVTADPWAEAFAESARLAMPSRSDDAPPYPVVLNAQVQRFLDRFTGQYRAAVEKWLGRSGRYLGMIREVLRSRDLPEDLAFTAMIESGFNPMAVSRAGAVGLWQFMASTARRYGLRVDGWVDERLDPEKSTFAAAAYLRDLYQQFGSWTLAQAAYNAGEVKVSRAVRVARTNDFWALTRTGLLKLETKEFVPQIHAATLIGRDPLQYGFETVETTVTAFEQISVPPSTDLRRLSRASGISFEMLRGLNPTLVRGITPPGSPYNLKIPVGTAPGVLAALEVPKARVASVALPVRASRTSQTHVVRPRDTVSSIAKHYGVSVGDVLRWNSLDRQDPIRPGDRLRVTDSTRLSPDRERQATFR